MLIGGAQRGSIDSRGSTVHYLIIIALIVCLTTSFHVKPSMEADTVKAFAISYWMVDIALYSCSMLSHLESGPAPTRHIVILCN